ncbi:hypothetical protein B0I35DRAFT_427415 [Stachybotrys elegans]|uniref:Uncharacterized protein n=1 Tax=Stachybotrys elegans TaxID=80388 RepID=A0A8K0SXF4_9HYPO|nr:hypothetical protein B0I35DRAFT_427415 [Stachybotrys elegans]
MKYQWLDEGDEPSKHYCDWWSYDTHLWPVRERFMVAFMDTLTDIDDWHNKIEDDDIVQQWWEEASQRPEKPLWDAILECSGSHIGTGWSSEMEQEFGPRGDGKIPIPRTRMLSWKAFEFCIDELQQKCKYFRLTGLIPTLDIGGSGVVKSDKLVGQDLRERLRDGFAQLRADQEASGLDWHPGTDGKVLNLVHPSMYPFIFGKSPFIRDEVVGVTDAIHKWAGKGQTSPEGAPPLSDPTTRTEYQWLPANVAWQDYSRVRFSSYINNLHPNRYPHIYQAIEELLGLVIPAWDQVLFSRRTKYRVFPECTRFRPPVSRFLPPGKGFEEFATPRDVWEKPNADLMAATHFKLTEPEIHSIVRESARCSSMHAMSYTVRSAASSEPPATPDPEPSSHSDYSDHPEHTECPCQQKFRENPEAYRHETNNFKWQNMRDAKFIDPEPKKMPVFTDYFPLNGLRERFEDLRRNDYRNGLQVYVKMIRIELTPEKPVLPAGAWHWEGLSNEEICATALFYVDSENITSSGIEFRTPTDVPRATRETMAQTESGLFNWYERVYGANLNGGCPRQYYGRVQTPQGRLLAYPNIFQRRVGDFHLTDPSKPGHCSLITLWLAEPMVRLVSTANVPPQRLDWWVDATFPGDAAGANKVPPEIVLMMHDRPGWKEHMPEKLSARAQGYRLSQEVYNMVRDEFATTSNLWTRAEAEKQRRLIMGDQAEFRQILATNEHYGRYHFLDESSDSEGESDDDPSDSEGGFADGASEEEDILGVDQYFGGLSDRQYWWR